MSASLKESILLKGGYLKTTFVCKFCPSEPGLHPGLYFEEYHTKIDFYDRYYEIYCAIILRKLCLGKLGLFSKYEVSTSGNNQCCCLCPATIYKYKLLLILLLLLP